MRQQERLISARSSGQRGAYISDNRTMATILRTPRVGLREFNGSDLDVLAEMMADKDQMSLYPRPRTREETRGWIERNVSLYRDRGYGFWLMERIVGGDFLGYCGIRPLVIEGLEEIEMGWHTRKPFWNRGLATEAAAACRALAVARFGISRLVATIDPANEPSHRVAHKIGMRVEKEILLDDWSCNVYSAERPALASFATILDTDGHVLLLRRRDIDIWECPGGAAEQQESAADAEYSITRAPSSIWLTDVCSPPVKRARRRVSKSPLATSQASTGDRTRTPWSSNSFAT